LRVAVVRSEKLVVEARDILGTQRNENIHVGSHYQAAASKD
jgi:hypothetical protein